MERLDKNLWYRVKRYPPQPDLSYPVVTEHYKKTGVMRDEASHQYFNRHLSGGAVDKNIYHRMIPFKAKQPTLPKRVIKDLDPQSRIRGQLDLTKKERQQSAIIKSLQGTSDLIRNFISSPKIDLQGNAVLDPITNQPIMERKNLKDILSVSQNALFKILTDSDVVINVNVRNIIVSFTSVQILNVLAKFRGIVSEFPNMSQDDKGTAFRGAIIEERMRDLSSAPAGMEDILGTELDEEKMTEYTDNWDIDYTTDIFPTRGFTPNQWTQGGWDAQRTVEAYVLTRLKRNPGQSIKTVDGNNIIFREMSRQFSADRQHVFDLQTLQFVRPTDATAMTAMATAHS